MISERARIDIVNTATEECREKKKIVTIERKREIK